MKTCRLWVTLGSGRRHRGEPHPSTFLRFNRTGLLVGLPDEPGGQLVEDTPLSRFAMRRVDAEGLGLTPEDFAEGVAICREEPGADGLGWRCDRVQLLIGAEERVEALAPRVRPGTTAGLSSLQTIAAPAVSRRSSGRILAVVDAEATDREVVDEAAALARDHGAALLLVATGELPETARHAAEEREALTRRLEELVAPLGDLPVRAIVMVGGDPVRDVLAVADAEDVDLIVAPEAHSRFAHTLDPPIAAALARRAAVPVHAVSARARSAGRDEAFAVTVIGEARLVIPGLPRDGAGDRWRAHSATHVHRALGSMVFDRGRLAVDARWCAAPGSPVDHFDLAPVVAAVLAEPAWPPGVDPRVARLSSEVVAVPDRASERLELRIRTV